MLRAAPLFPVAAGLIIGIANDREWPCSPALYTITLLVLSAGVIAILLRRRAKVAFVAAPSRLREFVTAAVLLVGSVCVGGLIHWSSARCPPVDSIARIANADGAFVRMRGRIITAPQVLSPPPNPFSRWIPQSERTAFVLGVDAVEGESGYTGASGRVRVTVYEAVLGLRAGEVCEVFGRLRALSPPDNPGAFDWRTYSLAQGIVARATCQHRENVHPLPQSASTGHFSGWQDWLRQRAVLLLTDDMADVDEPSGLLESMLLGQRSQASAKLNDVFVRSGCVHYLSVSGVHMVIVMLLARLACQAAGTSRNITTWSMLLAVVMYALLAEPRPPILRAAIIGVVYCAARLIGRERAYLNWTSLAAALLLIVNPLWLFDIGFQLSFAAVLGVAYLTPVVQESVRCSLSAIVSAWRRGGGKYAEQDRIMRAHAAAMSRVPPGHLTRFAHWCGRLVIGGLAVSVAASLAGLPLVAIHFYRVQPWSALSSTVLMLPVTILMALGILKMLAASLLPGFGGVIGVGPYYSEASVMWLVERLAALPFASVPAPVVPWWVQLAFYACLALWARRVHESTATVSARHPQGARPMARGLPRYSSRIGLAMLIVAVLIGARIDKGRSLRLTFLAVGRGSTTVIELPDGQTVLYDAGASFSSDPGRNVIVPFLLSRGLHRIDKLHISHPNLDHFSGVPSLLSEVDTAAVVINPCFESRVPAKSPSADLLRLLDAAGTPMERLPMAPAEWHVGEVKFELLWPARFDSLPAANDTSTVLRISTDRVSVLLTGDIDELAQDALLERGDLKADVLVLPHHGSVRRTTRRFLEAVGADILIRSSDERMDETINGLVQITDGRTVYNTADLGAVTVEIGQGGLSVTGFREASR